jgi:hypothetical protein
MIRGHFAPSHRLATRKSPPVGRAERAGAGVTDEFSFTRYEGQNFLYSGEAPDGKRSTLATRAHSLI